MPTTLTGLLLFVVILLPGITYVAIRERKTPEQRRSAFRETAAVATVSIAANAAALTLFSLVHTLWPDATPEVDRAVQDMDVYFRDNYAEVTLWSVAILAAAIVIAAVAAVVAGKVRNPHPAEMSSWWLLFDDWPRRMNKRMERKDIYARAACYLNDGSMVEGTVQDFNRLTDETPDRDLILVRPIKRLGADGNPVNVKSHAASISARDIRTMLLYYESPPVESPEPEPSPDPPAEAGET